jgi:hypothetical protein
MIYGQLEMYNDVWLAGIVLGSVTPGESAVLYVTMRLAW